MSPGGNRPVGSWPMRTTKAYLAGLGTTGVLIASVLTLMAIGTGIVGFDGHELGGGSSPLERVVVGDGADGKRARSRPRPTDAAGPPVVAGAEQTREAGGRRDAAGRRAPRRRSHGHGGVPVSADVLSGGVAAERGTGARTGKRPERSAGGAAPRRAGGGVPVPASVERAQEDLQDVLKDSRPPGPRR